MATAQGEVFWANPQWHAYTGTTPQQSGAKGWADLLDADELPAVMERWTAAITSGQPFETVFSMRGADGGTRPFLSRAAPARDPTGRVTGWFGISTDVVELRRQRQSAEEDSLRVAGELDDLKRLFAQSPSFMAMLHGPEHRIVLTNPPYMRLIGHREVLGRTVAEALPRRSGKASWPSWTRSTGAASPTTRAAHDTACRSCPTGRSTSASWTSSISR
jgi:PAS domain S-box-containing protein